jgi:hypothetical protein
MNVFGVGDEGLTNPLTTDLLANGFNALNFSEVHTDELHDNTGTGKIVVHEEFNMTNNRITNMADPVAAKDAVTLDYYESNIPTPYIPYDWMVAYSDETTTLGPAASPLPVTYQIPRSFAVDYIWGFLTTATTNALSFGCYANGTFFGQIDFNAGALISNGNIPTLPVRSFGDRITLIPTVTDPTATGLKVLLTGSY